MLPTWQAELADAYTRPEDLLRDLELDPGDFSAGYRITERFPVRVTRSFASRISKGDPHDPLLRQVLPLAAELDHHPDFTADPVGDLGAASAPGILHKYHGRILLVTTGACAIHCRYCFRREFPYGDHQLSKRREDDALALIRRDGSLREVILSGGDPLVLSDERLGGLVSRIAECPQIRRIRIHTRLPIVLPSRMTDELIARLGGTRLRIVIVIHANHAAEFDDAVSNALTRLRNAGLALLNQSVLLRGVNDSAEALVQLSETLIENGVLPYYLHLLDRARGTAHFDVPEEVARTLLRKLRETLPGYLVPRLVRELPDTAFKTPIA